MSGKEIICACSKSQDLVTDLEGNRITGLPARSCQLFGSLAVCGGSFTDAGKINLNQSVFRQVNVSATTMGRVTRLAVQEGQRVRAGQFLLEIDPRSLAGQIDRGEAAVAGAQASLAQSTTAVDQARASLELAQQTLQRQQDLSRDGLTTRESLEHAQNDVTLREADLRAACV